VVIDSEGGIELVSPEFAVCCNVATGMATDGGLGTFEIAASTADLCSFGMMFRISALILAKNASTSVRSTCSSEFVDMSLIFYRLSDVADFGFAGEMLKIYS
jgi:hypothetical protein